MQNGRNTTYGDSAPIKSYRLLKTSWTSHFLTTCEHAFRNTDRTTHQPAACWAMSGLGQPDMSRVWFLDHESAQARWKATLIFTYV